MKKYFNKNLVMTEKKKKITDQETHAGYVKNSLKMKK